MEEFISDWFIPMDFGNDLPDEEPDGEDNFNFDLLVHQGVAITTVQKLLGHTSVKTTEIYSEVFDETIIKDLTRANQKYYNRRNVKQNQIKSQKYPEKYLRQ